MFVIGRLNIIKIQILPKQSTDSVQLNSYQNPSDIFMQRLKKKNPKIQMASQGTLNRQNNPDKEEQS